MRTGLYIRFENAHTSITPLQSLGVACRLLYGQPSPTWVATIKAHQMLTLTQSLIGRDERTVSHDIDGHPNVSYTQCLIRRQVLLYDFAIGIPSSFASARVSGQLTSKRQSNCLSDPSIVEFQYSCRRRERRESSSSSTWLLPFSSNFNETDSNWLKRSQASVIVEMCRTSCGLMGICSNIFQRSPFSW